MALKKLSINPNKAKYLKYNLKHSNNQDCNIKIVIIIIIIILKDSNIIPSNDYKQSRSNFFNPICLEILEDQN